MVGLKMKKILFTSLLVANALYAEETTMEQQVRLEQERLAYLKSQGIVYLGKGVHLLKEQDLNLSKKILKKIKDEKISLKTKGFVESKDPIIDELSNLQATVDNDLSLKFKKISGTGWHKDYKNLKLTWEFKPMPESMKILAYAPTNSYNAGWNGIVVALQTDNKSYCRYEEKNIKATQASINLPLEQVTKDINDKNSILYVQGNEHDGFVYQINWFDDDFSHEFNCLASTYSKDLLQYYIGQAKLIDSR